MNKLTHTFALYLQDGICAIVVFSLKEHLKVIFQWLCLLIDFMFTSDTYEDEKWPQLLLLLWLPATNKAKEDRIATENSPHSDQILLHNMFPTSGLQDSTAEENSPQSGCTCLNTHITISLFGDPLDIRNSPYRDHIRLNSLSKDPHKRPPSWTELPTEWSYLPVTTFTSDNT
jgi:hypothetical protein